MIIDVCTFRVNTQKWRTTNFELATRYEKDEHPFPIPTGTRNFTTIFDVVKSDTKIKHELVLSLLLWCDGAGIDHRGLIAHMEFQWDRVGFERVRETLELADGLGQVALLG